MVPKTIETTIKEIEIKSTRLDVIKAWAPIVTAIIALISAVIVSLISASAQKVDTIVDRLDNKLIPKLEHKIDKIEKKLAEIAVYQGIFEKEIEKLKNKHPVYRNGKKVDASLAHVLATHTANIPITEFKLPRVQQINAKLPALTPGE